MCGIVGYVGEKDGTIVLTNALKNLEYRGYDSSGIAVFENNTIRIVKAKGRILDLENKMRQVGSPFGHCGIGHTRWATHGEPNDVNSHPHGNERVSIVHNGIIENYIQIRDRMIRKGYTFISQTDTEAVAIMLDYYYKGDPLFALKKSLEKIKGSYALCVLFKDFPDTIYAVKKDSPLVIGLGNNENFIASDIPAILKYTRDYYRLSENEILILKKDNVQILDLDGEPVKKEVFTASWDIEAAEKGGYPHFMLKEIYEQPKSILNTISSRIVDGVPNFGNEFLSDEFLANIKSIHIVACGTAMHAGMIGKQLIEKLVRINVKVDIASEFRYSEPILDKNDLVIVITQSGETADTLAALHLAKSKGVNTLAIVNVIGSSIAMEADNVIYTWAGPEIAVASTKAFSVQVAIMYLITFKLGLVKNKMEKSYVMTLCNKLMNIPTIIEKILENPNNCKYCASKFQNAKDLFFIGRGLDYTLTLEGSLKLKEISYIHSEAYAAGELKHGSIALVEKDIPIIAIATQKELVPKMFGNIKEVNARGAKLLLICSESTAVAEEIADYIIRIPDIDDLFTPLVTIIPLQLFAYYTAVLRGCDVDKPRNLAKSVTVE